MPGTRWLVVGSALLLQVLVVVAAIRLFASNDGPARLEPLRPTVPLIGPLRSPEPRIDILYGAVPEPSGPGWRLIGRLSAHAVLIVDVETDRLHEAVVIAKHLIEPVKEGYVEALVYFYRSGRRNTFPTKRVQWTLDAGYVETIFP